MNGEVCCILGVCCPPESQERVEALARELVKDAVCSDTLEAYKYATWILKHFALAPKSLEPFVVDIVKHAKHKPHRSTP